MINGKARTCRRHPLRCIECGTRIKVGELYVFDGSHANCLTCATEPDAALEAAALYGPDYRSWRHV